MPDAPNPPGGQKLQIDSDWKSQAQSEKERLARQEEQRAAQAPKGQGELPPADFRTLIDMLASQAFMGLGALGDPKSGRIVVDLEGSKFNIDLLDVIEQKTKGNLSEEEARDLNQVLAALRSRFVQIVQMVARQGTPGLTPGLAPGLTPGTPGAPSAPGAPGAAGPAAAEPSPRSPLVQP